MGDRTTVTLSFLETQQDEALKHFDSEANEAWLDEPLAYHRFVEVNYGTLDFLYKLKAAGIAYESEWDSGSNFGPGVKSCRFTKDGKAIEKSISDDYINPSLSKLLELIDDYGALKEYIQKHNEEVTVLPWDNQEEYGKLYRAKQLINPT